MVDNFNVVAEVFVVVAALAVFIERALSLVYEHRLMIGKLDGKKEVIAFAVAVFLCWFYQVDALAAMFGKPLSAVGIGVTAAVVAGGAKGSVRLFRDWLQVRSSAYANHEAKR